MVAHWLVMACVLAGAAADLLPYISGVKSEYILELDLSNSAATNFTATAVLNMRTNDQVADRDQTNFVVNAVDLTPLEVSIVYPNKRTVPVLPNTIKIDAAAETWSIPGIESIQNNSEYKLTIVYAGKMNSNGGLFRTKLQGQNYIGCRLYPTHGRKVFPGLNRPGDVVSTELTLKVSYNGQVPVVVTGLDFVSTQKTSHTLTTVYKSAIPTTLNGLYFTIGPYTQPLQSYRVWVPESETERPSSVYMALNLPTIRSLYNATGKEPVVVVVPGLTVQSDRGLGLAALSTQLGTQSGTHSTISLKQQDTATIDAIVKGLFGAVVSPRTWEDTWIVESVPRYIAETLVTQMSRWEDWGNMALPSTMIALAHSWSAKSTAVIPKFKDISQVISYLHDPAVDKGAVIMALIESILPNDAKLKFFSAYVKDRKGKAVSTDDFLNQYADMHQLNTSSNFPKDKTLKELILPWLTQTGYPSLLLKRSSNDIVATEEQFSYPDKEKISGPSSWVLPIKYGFVSLTAKSNDGNQTQWLLPNPNSNLKLATNLDGNTTVIVNGPGYRSLYDFEDLSIIDKILKADLEKIPSYVRATLLNDGQAFAKAGKLSYQGLLDMMKYLNAERDLEPWIAAVNAFQDLWTLLYFKDEKIKTQFSNFAGDLLRPAFLDLGLQLDDPSQMRGMLRSIVTKSLCDYDDYDCRQQTRKIYIDYIVSGQESSITAIDLIPTIYCNGLRDLTDATELKKTLVSKYNPTYSDDIKKSIFSYLACPSNNTIINTLLKYLLVEKTISNMPTEDIILGFKEITSRPENLDVAFTFLVDNYSKLLPSLKDEDKAALIKILGKKGSSAEHIQKLKTIAVSSSKVEQDALKEALKAATSRQDFVNKYYYDIAYGLFGYLPEPRTSTSTDSPKPTPPSPSPPSPPPSPTPKHNAGGALATSLTQLLASLFILLLL